MIVAVAAARVVQVAADPVVDVVAVRHRLVATSGAVGVGRIVSAAGVRGRAGGGIRPVHGDHALVDVVAVPPVEMALVEEVVVVTVPDGRVTAAGTVLVRMVVMGRVAHGLAVSFRPGAPGVAHP